MKAQFLLCWTLLLSVVSANEPQNGPTDHPGLARQWTGQHKGVSAAPNCADTDPNCPVWASTGECIINPRYMLTACRKSCKQCAAPNFLLTLVREIASMKSLLSKLTEQYSSTTTTATTTKTTTPEECQSCRYYTTRRADVEMLPTTSSTINFKI